MKKQYDFNKARRGPVVPAIPGKTRITIRLDNNVIEHFQATVDRSSFRPSLPSTFPPAVPVPIAVRLSA